MNLNREKKPSKQPAADFAGRANEEAGGLESDVVRRVFRRSPRRLLILLVLGTDGAGFNGLLQSLSFGVVGAVGDEAGKFDAKAEP